MGWTNDQPATLVVPAGAGPGDPRQVFTGSDIPAELQAYYTANYAVLGPVVTSVILFYVGNATDDYYYEANIELLFDSSVVHATGSVIAGTVLQYAFMTSDPNGYTFSVEDPAGPTIPPSLLIDGTGFFGIELGAFYYIDGFRAARGTKDNTGSAVNTGATAVEAVILTSNNVDFLDGAAYKVTFGTLEQSSVANQVQFNVRRTNIGGAIKFAPRSANCPGGAGNEVWCEYSCIIRNVSGATVTDKLVVTHTPSAGTVLSKSNGTGQFRWLRIEDFGDATQFTGTATI